MLLVLHRQVSSDFALIFFQVSRLMLVDEVCVIMEELEEQCPASPVRCITWDYATLTTLLNT